MPSPKILIVHGLGSKPNGGWRPWLLTELSAIDVFGFALAMPKSANPVKGEWIDELARYVDRYQDDDVYLVGHSLGGATIMRYLETAPERIKIAGVALVSAPCRPNQNPETRNFFDTPVDFAAIRARAIPTVVIHGEDDGVVPFEQARTIAEELGCDLVPVPNGGHLMSADGWKTLPPLLDALKRMMEEKRTDDRGRGILSA